jgi:hypothetical protein
LVASDASKSLLFVSLKKRLETKKVEKHVIITVAMAEI